MLNKTNLPYIRGRHWAGSAEETRSLTRRVPAAAAGPLQVPLGVHWQDRRHQPECTLAHGH
jgi:hypothetical protein